MKIIKLTILSTILLTGLQLKAHTFLTEMLVYPEDTVTMDPHVSMQIIETIHLTEDELNAGVKKKQVKSNIKRIAARKQEHRVAPQLIDCDDWDGVFKTCGAFDHFSQGRAMAIDVCAGLSVSYADVFPDGLVPQFVGPSTFIDSGSAAENHHDGYNFSHGLTFNCVAVISNMETD